MYIPDYLMEHLCEACMDRWCADLPPLWQPGAHARMAVILRPRSLKPLLSSAVQAVGSPLRSDFVKVVAVLAFLVSAIFVNLGSRRWRELLTLCLCRARCGAVLVNRARRYESCFGREGALTDRFL